MKNVKKWAALFLTAAMLTGCGSAASETVPPNETPVETTAEADSGTDTGNDAAADAPADTGSDASADQAADASADAGSDTTEDPAADASADAPANPNQVDGCDIPNVLIGGYNGVPDTEPFAFVRGMKIIMYSADELEAWESAHGTETAEPVEEGGLYGWAEKKFGEKATWNMAMILSVITALLFTIAVFIVAPTILVNWMKHVTENEWALNFVEGFLRILLFIGYVVAIARVPDIHRVFQYHGAEHKTIHCFENGHDLTPGNALTFERLHPRCGTSFLVFVMFVSWILFSFLGWPDLLWRITSRVILLPVVAGVSYELLRWAGRSDNIVVKILSVPGLLLQKITTADPDEKQLEVAICSMNAVLKEEIPLGVWDMDESGKTVLGEAKDSAAAEPDAQAVESPTEEPAAEDAEGGAQETTEQ